jgi:uncharacterized protein YcgI (DUF1989 family)
VSFNASYSHLIPPQDGRGVVVPAGTQLRVTDVEGTQVADVWAFSADDSAEWLSTGHTRCTLRRLFPHVGEDFFTNRRDPILRLVSDDSPGVHDMLYPPCDSQLFINFGLSGDHPSCTSNFRRITAALGVESAVVPASINLFQNSPPDAEGDIPLADALSRAGDGVTFLALRDVVFIVTSCSVDFPPGNGDRCTPMLLETDREPSRSA